MPSSRGSSQPDQGSNPSLPHCRWILYHLSHQGRPRRLERVSLQFSRGNSWSRNWTGVSCIARQILYQLSYQGNPFKAISRSNFCKSLDFSTLKSGSKLGGGRWLVFYSQVPTATLPPLPSFIKGECLTHVFCLLGWNDGGSSSWPALHVFLMAGTVTASPVLRA